jgi:lipoate-protein ligase A
MRLGYLDLTLPGIEANLALDEALLNAAEEGTGGPVLRVWESPTFAVVLGASNRWREEVRVEACRADGVQVVRRSSGGGAVVIGPGALNVAVVLPADAAPGLEAVDRAQAYVLERFAGSLRDLGYPVEVLGSGDLTMGRRKFAGSAQRRLRHHFLVHCTILYRFPLDRIARYLAPPARQPSYREGRSHEDFVRNLDLPRDRLMMAIRSAWLPGDRPAAVPPVPEAMVEQLVATKFGDPAWIERF